MGPREYGSTRRRATGPLGPAPFYCQTDESEFGVIGGSVSPADDGDDGGDNRDQRRRGGSGHEPRDCRNHEDEQHDPDEHRTLDGRAGRRQSGTDLSVDGDAGVRSGRLHELHYKPDNSYRQGEITMCASLCREAGNSGWEPIISKLGEGHRRQNPHE